MNKLLNISDLENFTGTRKYYGYLGGVKLTDGAKYLADRAGCYWLMDIVASCQHDLTKYPFQLWSIRVLEDKKAIVECREDTGTPAVIHQEIKYTDFPLKEFEFYCINKVILLKSEY